MITAAISLGYHDASITVLKNNKIDVFVQEERLNRIKYSAILDVSFVKILKKYKKIDQLIFCNISIKKTFSFSNNIQEVITNFLNNLNDNQINIKQIIMETKNHHLFHACSAFYLSGFKEAISLVIDGFGSEINIFNNYFSETTSIYKCSYPNKIIPLYKKVYDINQTLNSNNLFLEEKNKEFDLNISHSYDIGAMFMIGSEYLNFRQLDCGKTMGLASYGKKSKKIPNLLHQYGANMNIFTNNRTIHLKNNKYFKDNSFKFKANFAFALQKALEKIFIKNIKYILSKTKTKNIVFSGGCALNVLGNSVIKKKFNDLNFFVDPIAKDSGLSLGAALYYYYNKTKSNTLFKFDSIYLGPKYKTLEIKKNIKTWITKNAAQ